MEVFLAIVSSGEKPPCCCSYARRPSVKEPRRREANGSSHDIPHQRWVTSWTHLALNSCVAIATLVDFVPESFFGRYPPRPRKKWSTLKPARMMAWWPVEQWSTARRWGSALRERERERVCIANDQNWSNGRGSGIARESNAEERDWFLHKISRLYTIVCHL